MKFKMTIESMQNALNAVKDTIGNEKTQSDGLRLIAEKSRVRLTTNDGSYATDTWVDAEVDATGEILLPAKLFVQYFAKLDGREVSFTKKNSTTLEVKTKRGRQEFMALAYDFEEVLHSLVEKSRTDISGKTLKQMIQSVSFAVSKEDNYGVERTGIHIFSNGKVTQFSATNGTLIGTIRKKLNMDKLDVIVATKTLNRLSRILRDDEKATIISYNESVSAVELNGTIYTFPQYEGVFPDVSKVIKDIEPDTFINVDKQGLINLLERAELLCGSTGSLTADGSVLSIKGSSEYATFNEFMFASVEGPKVEVRVLIKSLLDMVKHMQDDSIELGIKEGKPILCSPGSRLNQRGALAIMGN